MTSESWRAGPGIDVVGDVHGCADELADLLARLGYATPGDGATERRLAFVGDLVDRGPDSARVLETVMLLCQAGVADCVLGNHDDGLRWALSGRAVEPVPEREATLLSIAARGPEFANRVRVFLAGLPAHLVLDDGRLVVAHAGLPEAFHGSDSLEARGFAIYGPSTGRRDAYGFPERVRPTPSTWAQMYRGQALIVYGHAARATPLWIGRTVNIDTDCSRGGNLTALRYPENTFVSVPARAVYWARR